MKRAAFLLAWSASVAHGAAAQAPPPSLPSARPSPAAPAQEIDTRAIDLHMARYLARTGLPGAAVVVTRGTQVVHARGYGVSSDGRPVTTTTLLPIASLSKSMAALAVMQLVERGRIALDSPVVRYLPEFVLADPRASAITVRQLLDHTSGMSDMTLREKSLWQPTSLRQAMTRLREATLATVPGQTVHYHNPNYHVVARLVEVVSGEPYAQYLASHVFRPTGMQRSATVASTYKVPGLAMGHSAFYGITIAVEEPYWFLDGSSGVVSTADDMAQWLILQSNGGVSASGNRIVSERSLAEMHGGSAGAGRRGLGWSRRDSSDAGPARLGHSGWLFTSSASQVLLESGYAVAVMANRGIGLGGDDADRIAGSLIAISEGKQPSVGAPTGSILAVVFIALTLGTVALGIRGVRRARTWAQRATSHSVIGTVLRLLPLAGCIPLFAFLPSILGGLGGGRDATWFQYWLMAAPLLVWLAVMALVALVVIVARVHCLVQRPPIGAQTASDAGAKQGK